MRKQQYDGMRHLASIIKNDQKNKEDLDYIYSFLMQIPFFEQILQDFKDQDDLIYQLCSKIKYMELPSKTVIIKQGSKTAAELFILIQGSVLVLQRDIPLNQNIAPIAELHYYSNFTLQQPGQSSIHEIPYYEEIDYTQSEEQIFENKFWNITQRFYGKIKAEINTCGVLIGEKALLEQKARAATIITNQPTQVLILTKEDFDTMKTKYQIQEKEKRNLLNRAFPKIFESNSYTRVYKEKIYRYFYDYKVFKDQVIVVPKQTQDSAIYLIYQGEFQVDAFLTDKKLSQQKQEGYQDVDKYFLKGNKKKFKTICLISSGSLIGEEYEIEGQYQFKVSCTSPYGYLLKFYMSDLKKFFSLEQLDVLKIEWNKKKFALESFRKNQKSVIKLYTPIFVETNSETYIDQQTNQIKIKEQLLQLHECNHKKVPSTFSQKRSNPVTPKIKLIPSIDSKSPISANKLHDNLSKTYKMNIIEDLQIQSDQQSDRQDSQAKQSQTVERNRTSQDKRIEKYLNQNLLKTHNYLTKMNLFQYKLKTPLDISKQNVIQLSNLTREQRMEHKDKTKVLLHLYQKNIKASQRQTFPRKGSQPESTSKQSHTSRLRYQRIFKNWQQIEQNTSLPSESFMIIGINTKIY